MKQLKESIENSQILKPCRYCGREVKIHRVQEMSWSVYKLADQYQIRCQCGIQTKCYKTRSGVIKCWNREVKL